MAKIVNDRQSGAEAEVHVAQSEPLQSVRPSARLSAQVSALPHLLPAAFARRLHPGHHEGELVRPAERDRSIRMSMTDPIADMLTRIRNGITVASRTHRASRVEAEGGDRPHPQERGLHPQLQPGRRKSRRRRSASTSSTRRRRAGHPRHRAHLAPGPPRLPQQGGDSARARRPRPGHRLDLEGRALGQEAVKSGVGGEVLCQVW